MSFTLRYVEIFEQIKMDGWMDIPFKVTMLTVKSTLDIVTNHDSRCVLLWHAVRWQLEMTGVREYWPPSAANIRQVSFVGIDPV